MGYRTILVPKHVAPGLDMSPEVLEQRAANLRTKGTTTIADPDGTCHRVRVTDVTVTPRGIEATIHLTEAVAQLVEDIASGRTQPLSMGYQVGDSTDGDK